MSFLWWQNSRTESVHTLPLLINSHHLLFCLSAAGPQGPDLGPWLMAPAKAIQTPT